MAVLVALAGCDGDAPSSGTATAPAEIDPNAREPGATGAAAVVAPAAPAAAAPGPEAAAPRPFPPTLREALALVERGRFEAARELVATVLRDAPDDAQAVFVSAMTYHRERRYEQAEPLFVRAIELDPSYAVVHHFLGYCRFHLGDFAGARASFAAHLQSDPDESDSHFGLGLVELGEGRPDEATRRFRHAIDLIEALETSNPRQYQRRKGDLAKCHARLADVAFERGDYDGARDELHTSIAVDPNQYASYFRLSQIERRLGNDAEADRLQTLYEQMAAARRGRRGPGDVP